jgi:hypothetical protein
MVPAMNVSLDPTTGDPVGQSTDEKYTWDQIVDLAVPCPRCRARVRFDRVPAGGMESAGEPLFYVGRPIYPCRCFSPIAE